MLYAHVITKVLIPTRKDRVVSIIASRWLYWTNNVYSAKMKTLYIASNSLTLIGNIIWIYIGTLLSKSFNWENFLVQTAYNRKYNVSARQYSTKK